MVAFDDAGHHKTFCQWLTIRPRSRLMTSDDTWRVCRPVDQQVTAAEDESRDVPDPAGQGGCGVVALVR